jgi:hypothetical protein
MHRVAIVGIIASVAVMLSLMLARGSRHGGPSTGTYSARAVPFGERLGATHYRPDDGSALRGGRPEPRHPRRPRSSALEE